MENHFCGEHAELILSSFSRLTGRSLIDSEHCDLGQYRLLYEAPFCVVSHDTNDDPVFNYGNRRALELFEMKWLDFTRLASRHSAEPQLREEREHLLARVTEYGFIENYKGIRVSSSGKRFLIEDSMVWNLIDEHGVHRGQAAVLYQWSRL